jgi:tRNA A-37 threonylcarbamoyl transferase component Bud32
VPDILAIVSKAVFERDARIDDELVGPGDVWPTDRYTSAHKTFERLADGGRIFLVTVRPPHEQLWFVGMIDSPQFDDGAWIAAEPNALPVTNITPLRKTITFESGKGISQDKGTLGMSLQTPRALTAGDVQQILSLVSGAVDHTLPHTAQKSQPPRMIGGKYEVLRELGKGGMGIVYEARHAGTGRRVALKEIMKDSLGDKTLIERFYREARATSAIETRHITPVLDTGSDPDTQNPYLVMELLTGEDLQSYLDRAGILDEELAVKIVAQACVGLARAHEAGVIHRDIKPANLFLHRLDGEVVVKLLDFGVARVKEGLATIDNRALTATGVMLGTPLYMSPEQVVGAKNLDHRTDVWSLGIVLYEALTGVTPYDDVETIGGLLVAICSKPPRVPKHVPGPIAEVLTRSLALEPTDRYSTADAMLADLRAIVPAGLALAEGTFGPLPPPMPEL